MATPLDLQEQEQVDARRAFWKQYGNLITWVLVLVLGAFAAWNGWQLYQRKQAEQAGAMYDELDRAAQAGEADKAARVFSDLRERHPRTAFAQQGALVAARVQAEKGQADAARATLVLVLHAQCLLPQFASLVCGATAQGAPWMCVGPPPPPPSCAPCLGRSATACPA